MQRGVSCNRDSPLALEVRDQVPEDGVERGDRLVDLRLTHGGRDVEADSPTGEHPARQERQVGHSPILGWSQRAVPEREPTGDDGEEGVSRREREAGE